jgi:hypothetical protein
MLLIIRIVRIILWNVRHKPTVVTNRRDGHMIEILLHCIELVLVQFHSFSFYFYWNCFYFAFCFFVNFKKLDIFLVSLLAISVYSLIKRSDSLNFVPFLLLRLPVLLFNKLIVSDKKTPDSIFIRDLLILSETFRSSSLLWGLLVAVFIITPVLCLAIGSNETFRYMITWKYMSTSDSDYFDTGLYYTDSVVSSFLTTINIFLGSSTVINYVIKYYNQFYIGFGSLISFGYVINSLLVSVIASKAIIASQDFNEQRRNEIEADQKRSIPVLFTELLPTKELIEKQDFLDTLNNPNHTEFFRKFFINRRKLVEVYSYLENDGQIVGEEMQKLLERSTGNISNSTFLQLVGRIKKLSLLIERFNARLFSLQKEFTQMEYRLKDEIYGKIIRADLAPILPDEETNLDKDIPGKELKRGLSQQFTESVTKAGRQIKRSSSRTGTLSRQTSGLLSRQQSEKFN